MQTLTPGSFLKLENSDSVEALKFTARRLAEHTANVVKENLQPSALAGLASNLWEKAEYVARETEQRRLREIFTENFTERFRELKPEVSLAEALISEVLSAASIVENNSPATANTPAPEIVEKSEGGMTINENAFSASPRAATDVTEVEGKRDEFLGFVKTDEPFTTAPAAETESVATTEPEKIQTIDAPAAETSKPEEESAETQEQTKSETEKITAERKVSAENANAEKSPPAAKAPAEIVSQTGNANKSNALQTGAKEPFEFGKCTINLNLTLLPSSGERASRKAIVSASSHGSPPEIEFLEIKEGEDLTEIAELVRGKLAKYKNGLPAKYIEQLRQSKTKPAKKSPTVRTPLAVPTKTTANEPKVEKTIGVQKSEQESIVETAKPETDVPAASSAFAPTVSTPIAANEIQGSLF